MKTYIRTFTNPLLALSFIDGVSFINDPDLVCSKPKREDENKWVVEIMDYDEDDDDNDDNKTITTENNKEITWQDVMKVSAESTLDEPKEISNKEEEVVDNKVDTDCWIDSNGNIHNFVVRSRVEN